jgi:zinc protease
VTAGARLALLVTALGATPLFAQPAAPVSRKVLANGLTVLLQEDHGSPLVTVAVMYRVGARNEAAGTTGLAHYVEHMNFRATRGLPGHEITDAITRIGGRWNGYTWIDQTYYAETVPKEALEPMLALEAERMTQAVYDPEEFRQERSSVIAEWHSYDDPESLLYDAVLAASFEIHPYRHNTIGWLTDVERVTRDDAYTFYRRFYHPRNAVLAIVGGFEEAPTLRRVEARFGGIADEGGSSDVPTAEPPQTGQRRVDVRRPGDHARVLLAYRAPALAEADFATMVMFDALLAGGKGAYFTREYTPPASTPLRRAAEGVGLASDGVGTRWQASSYPYVYTVGASAPSEQNLPELEAALLRALEDAGTRRWSEQEWQAALRQVRTGWALDLDDQASRAHQLAFFEVAGGHEHLSTLPRRIGGVTRDDLARFVRERLQPHQATIGRFLPSPPAASAPPPPPASPPPDMKAPTPQPARRVRPAGSDRVEAQSEWTLANGLRVTVAPRPGTPLVALRARIEAGSRYDLAGHPGLSALATEWLATPRRGEPDGAPGLAWTLHDDPASMTSLRFVEVAAVGLADDLPALLETLAGRLTRAAPSDEALAQTLGRLRQRSVEWDAATDTALWRRALAEMFPADSAPCLPPWPRDGALVGIDLPSLEAFLATHVAPSRTTLVLAGGIDAAEAKRRLADTLQRWRAPSGATAPPRAWPQARGPAAWTEVDLNRPEKAQNDIRVVWAGDRARPWDRAATRVLLYLLGETGYAGRLGRALVEPGLVYSVYATLEEKGAPGFLMVRTAAAPGNTADVLRRIRTVLEEAAQGAFTQAELDEARAYLRGQASRTREGTASLASSVSDRALDATPSDTAALTLAQLNDSARRMFQRGAAVALVAGPGRR